MQIVRIFDDDFLLTVHYDGLETDTFTQIFNNWTDIEYLEGFFTLNEFDLKRDFWGGISIEDAVIETRNEALKLREYIYGLTKKTLKNRISIFKRLFKPLTKTLIGNDIIAKKKSYGLRKNSWLRIYALKLDDDMFVITGGAIKLTDNMEEREHTRKELLNLDNCLTFLKNQGIIDKDGMIELLEL
jgi:hypothetical protein